MSWTLNDDDTYLSFIKTKIGCSSDIMLFHRRRVRQLLADMNFHLPRTEQRDSGKLTIPFNVAGAASAISNAPYSWASTAGMSALSHILQGHESVARTVCVCLI